MKKTDIPFLFPVGFASGAQDNLVTYPLPYDNAPEGRVSLLKGFDPKNYTPLAAGGIPVNGADTAGLLKMLSLASKASEAGQIRPYDTAYSRQIGGYPQGALVADKDNASTLYLSLVDDNLTDPVQDVKQTDHARSWAALGAGGGFSLETAPLGELQLTQEGVTEAGYEAPVRIVSSLDVYNGDIDTPDRPPLGAPCTTLDDITPDFRAREMARLLALTTQNTILACIRQDKAIAKQILIIARQKAASIGVTL